MNPITFPNTQTVIINNYITNRYISAGTPGTPSRTVVEESTGSPVAPGAPERPIRTRLAENGLQPLTLEFPDVDDEDDGYWIDVVDDGESENPPPNVTMFRGNYRSPVDDNPPPNVTMFRGNYRSPFDDSDSEMEIDGSDDELNNESEDTVVEPMDIDDDDETIVVY
jgi:hypothetical protein